MSGDPPLFDADVEVEHIAGSMPAGARAREERRQAVYNQLRVTTAHPIACDPIQLVHVWNAGRRCLCGARRISRAPPRPPPTPPSAPPSAPPERTPEPTTPHQEDIA